jgi:hypothetical protein
MEIKKMYDIGQDVWKLNCNKKPIKGLVVSIIGSSKGIIYGVTYEGKVYYDSENILFPTKEELLKSL